PFRTAAHPLGASSRQCPGAATHGSVLRRRRAVGPGAVRPAGAAAATPAVPAVLRTAAGCPRLGLLARARADPAARRRAGRPVHPRAGRAAGGGRHATEAMSMHIGIDIVEIERIRTASRRSGEGFLNRVYTAPERDYIGDAEANAE